MTRSIHRGYPWPPARAKAHGTPDITVAFLRAQRLRGNWARTNPHRLRHILSPAIANKALRWQRQLRRRLRPYMTSNPHVLVSKPPA